MTTDTVTFSTKEQVFLVALVVSCLVVEIVFCVCCPLTLLYLRQQDLDHYLPLIQQALDDQCGVGRYTADVQGFDSDPIIEWYGDGASCRWHHDAFDCDCP